MYKVILHLFQFQDSFDKVQTELADLLVPNHLFPIIEYNILFTFSYDIFYFLIHFIKFHKLSFTFICIL